MMPSHLRLSLITWHYSPDQRFCERARVFPFVRTAEPHVLPGYKPTSSVFNSDTSHLLAGVSRPIASRERERVRTSVTAITQHDDIHDEMRTENFQSLQITCATGELPTCALWDHGQTFTPGFSKRFDHDLHDRSPARYSSIGRVFATSIFLTSLESKWPDCVFPSEWRLMGKSLHFL